MLPTARRAARLQAPPPDGSEKTCVIIWARCCLCLHFNELNSVCFGEETCTIQIVECFACCLHVLAGGGDRHRTICADSPPPPPSLPISATAQVRRGKQPRRKRNQVPTTQKRRAMERVFGLSCGEAKGPVVPNMRVEWGLATVRVHRRAHRQRGRERNGPGASCSMRSSGGTRTTSAPSKRTGSSLRKGGEGGSPTTPRQEATCTYWHQTRCTKCEC